LAVGGVALAAGALAVAALWPDQRPTAAPNVVMADPSPSPSERLENLLPTPTISPTPTPEDPEPSESPSASPTPRPFERGQEADGFSELNPRAMSADGRYVVFTSWASNLAPGDEPSDPDPFFDQPHGQDVFVRDVEKGTNALASVSSKEVRGNGNSFHAVMSADGRFIAFASIASNLVPGDTNKNWDIFIRDRVEGTTRRVSVDSAGGQASGASWYPSISSDGRFVTFDSTAPDLVSGDMNGVGDVFLHDTSSGKTTRVSVSSSEAEGNNVSLAGVISADGSVVAFNSDASNFFTPDDHPDPDRDGWSMDLFVRDLGAGTTTRIASTRFRHSVPAVSLSSDGRFVAFTSAADDLVPGDTNGMEDAFVFDRDDGTLVRASVSSTGAEADRMSMDPAISDDGRYVVFGSNATNLIVDDRHRCSGPDDGMWCGSDVYLHDTVTGATTLISRSSSDRQGNGDSGMPSMSADGRYVMFESRADDLVDPDTNRCKTIDGENQPCLDVFLRDTKTGTTIRLSDS
jgi:Tol biopolymer transport system component